MLLAEQDEGADLSGPAIDDDDVLLKDLAIRRHNNTKVDTIMYQCKKGSGSGLVPPAPKHDDEDDGVIVDDVERDIDAVLEMELERATAKAASDKDNSSDGSSSDSDSDEARELEDGGGSVTLKSLVPEKMKSSHAGTWAKYVRNFTAAVDLLESRRAACDAQPLGGVASNKDWSQRQISLVQRVASPGVVASTSYVHWSPTADGSRLCGTLGRVVRIDTSSGAGGEVVFSGGFVAQEDFAGSFIIHPAVGARNEKQRKSSDLGRAIILENILQLQRMWDIALTARQRVELGHDVADALDECAVCVNLRDAERSHTCAIRCMTWHSSCCSLMLELFRERVVALGGLRPPRDRVQLPPVFIMGGAGPNLLPGPSLGRASSQML